MIFKARKFHIRERIPEVKSSQAKRKRNFDPRLSDKDLLELVGKQLVRPVSSNNHGFAETQRSSLKLSGVLKLLQKLADHCRLRSPKYEMFSREMTLRPYMLWSYEIVSTRPGSQAVDLIAEKVSWPQDQERGNRNRSLEHAVTIIMYTRVGLNGARK